MRKDHAIRMIKLISFPDMTDIQASFFQHLSEMGVIKPSSAAASEESLKETSPEEPSRASHSHIIFGGCARDSDDDSSLGTLERTMFREYIHSDPSST